MLPLPHPPAHPPARRQAQLQHFLSSNVTPAHELSGFSQPHYPASDPASCNFASELLLPQLPLQAQHGGGGSLLRPPPTWQTPLLPVPGQPQPGPGHAVAQHHALRSSPPDHPNCAPMVPSMTSDPAPGSFAAQHHAHRASHPWMPDTRTAPARFIADPSGADHALRPSLPDLHAGVPVAAPHGDGMMPGQAPAAAAAAQHRASQPWMPDTRSAPSRFIADPSGADLFGILGALPPVDGNWHMELQPPRQPQRHTSLALQYAEQYAAAGRAGDNPRGCAAGVDVSRQRAEALSRAAEPSFPWLMLPTVKEEAMGELGQGQGQGPDCGYEPGAMGHRSGSSAPGNTSVGVARLSHAMTAPSYGQVRPPLHMERLSMSRRVPPGQWQLPGLRRTTSSDAMASLADLSGDVCSSMFAPTAGNNTTTGGLAYPFSSSNCGMVPVGLNMGNMASLQQSCGGSAPGAHEAFGGGSNHNSGTLLQPQQQAQQPALYSDSQASLLPHGGGAHNASSGAMAPGGGNNSRAEGRGSSSGLKLMHAGNAHGGAQGQGLQAASDMDCVQSPELEAEGPRRETGAMRGGGGAAATLAQGQQDERQHLLLSGAAGGRARRLSSRSLGRPAAARRASIHSASPVPREVRPAPHPALPCPALPTRIH